MNRLYAVESMPTGTGAVADHRLPLRAREVESFGRAVARAIGVNVPALPGEPEKNPKWVSAVARDLQQHRGSCLVIPGDHQPPSAHALAHVMNDALGNIGTTVIHTDSVEANPVDQRQSLHELTDDMKQGKVEILMILSGNPVFNAPADFAFVDAIQKVAMPVHLGLYYDETSQYCIWHIPETHYLESWGDIRAYDGTVTIIQPLIAPLYSGRTLHELLALLEGNTGQSSHDIVRQYWQQQNPSADFEDSWQSWLEAGVVPDTALAPKSVKPKPDWISSESPSRIPNDTEMEIVFRPDPSVFDGRFANNGWLQELPKPLTKLTWDNAAIISPAMAEHLGFNLGEISQTHSWGLSAPVVELRYRGRAVQAPVLVLPGHPDDSVTVHYGYGRQRGGKVAAGHGFNAYVLRGSDAPWSDLGLEIRPLEVTTALATTQHHFTMAGRDLVRIATPEELEKNPNYIKDMGESPSKDETLYHADEYPYNEYKWAMTVNLSNCVGCNACIVACDSENNIPVVGKSQVGRGREMHWLRVDHYYSGNLDFPAMHFEPVLCMQCENAPCELVCPVHATNHSSEGINQMVYNRCVGTKFCQNNCPYKVRRFNFLQYSDYVTPSMEPLYNPDVTVRGRGVMEKCTYCIQRIQEAKITASKEGRNVRDGEIVTACQAACPTRVFTFGDLNDPNSAVSRSAAESLNYGLLTDLNTRPRTTYLAKLRNPNPELEQGEGK